MTIDYLFVDASHFKMHDGARSEPVLAAYGITTEGNPVFLHLDGVSAESTDACVTFLEDMVARRLGSPVLTITDGAPGLGAAIDQVFPRARRQRCLIHRARNCVAKVSEIDQAAGEATTGRSSTSTTPSRQASRQSARRVVVHGSSKPPGPRPTPVRSQPSSTDSTTSSRTCTTPRALAPHPAHQPHLERTFGETRRRLKVIGRLRRAIGSLVDQGILTEVTGRKRNRVYLSQRILDAVYGITDDAMADGEG